METILILLRYILLYFIIISGSIFISYKTNKKVENCIIVNFAIIILTLYIFGLFEILKYGVWIIATANILLGLYTIIKNWNNKKNLKDKILTPGFILFTILFFILMITSYNKNLRDYDHYLYRSFNTKILYYTDCMSKGYSALYPPSINLLEYFFMKIIGAYIQGVESFAVQMLGFSLLIPLFSIVKNTKFMNLIITTIIICLPAIFANLVFYEAAYPDALLGLIIGYSIYMLVYEKDNRFKIITVSLTLSICTITKPVGFYISGLIIAIYLIIELLNNRNNIKGNVKKLLKSKELKNIIILIIVVLIIFASWEIFKKINNKYNGSIVRQDSSRVEGKPIEYVLKSIATTTFGYYEENHNSSDSNNDLIPKLYSLYTVMSPVRMGLYGVITVIMLISLIVYKYIIKDEEKNKFANIIISLTIGLILYIILLQLCYIVKFSTEEMLGHNGLNRYMPTFLLGMTYIIIAITVKNMVETKSRKINYIILIAIIISFTYLQSIANVTITSGIYNINSIEYCNNGRIPAKEIDEKIEDEAKVISISEQGETDLYNLMIKYYLYPNHKVEVYNNVNEKTINQIEEKLIETDEIYYIYFISVNNELNQITNNKFNIQVQQDTLYKVEKQNNQIILVQK